MTLARLLSGQSPGIFFPSSVRQFQVNRCSCFKLQKIHGFPGHENTGLQLSYAELHNET
jgi:hypothetical protein